MTQITELINGAKNVIRKEDAAKYATAKMATSHNGYAGTNAKERARIAQLVFQEHGETMNVEVRGVALTLTKGTSLSGRTSWYGSELTEEQYKAIGGAYTEGALKSYSLVINGDMMVYINSFTRKSEAARWKMSHYDYIDEAFVTIL